MARLLAEEWVELCVGDVVEEERERNRKKERLYARQQAGEQAVTDAILSSCRCLVEVKEGRHVGGPALQAQTRQLRMHVSFKQTVTPRQRVNGNM